MLTRLLLVFAVFGLSVALDGGNTAPSWKERFNEQRAKVQAEVQQELDEFQQEFADKKAKFDEERQKIRDTVDQYYNEAEQAFQARINKYKQGTGKKAAPFALEVEGEPSLYEVIRSKYEANKNSLHDKLNAEIDKYYPGFKQAAEAYEAQEAEKKAARKQQFEEFKENAELKMNETRQKFEEFAAQANEKLKADFEAKKQDYETKKEQAKDVLSDVRNKIKNGTHMIMDKIKAEKEAEAEAKLQAAQWISDKMKNKTEEWKKKHPLAASRSISDVTQFLNDASGASGWQTATTVYMIICFVITIGLLVLIFKQIKARAPYERLEGNVHPPAPNSMAQHGYNPNYGNTSTFVPSQTALRKDTDYPQLF